MGPATTSTHRRPTTTTTPSTLAPTTTTVSSGGVATFAETPGQPPDYISPLTPRAYAYPANTSQFSALMWRPLVWPGSGETLGPDTTKSLYSSISYNAAGTEVTITLKPWAWSNGAAITARDITFFINLALANQAKWSGGSTLDNIARATIAGPRTLVLTLKGSWSSFWFTDNELSLITPLPQQVWDRTGASAKVADADQTPAGARAVWSFLASQAARVSTFATNPLWKVVDGPWVLRSFSAAGPTRGLASFVPNPAYSGPDKPSLARFVEVPFASSTAEVDALAAGQIDVGYLPDDLLADRSVLASEGYTLGAWQGLGLSGIVPNLASPQVGPVLAQTYIRQALRSLVDQADMVSTIFGGFATPTYGPVPLDPSDPYASPMEKSNPYPFSISAAAVSLSRHGWKASQKGTPAVCTDAPRCGPGIAKGQPLVFQLDYPAGNSDLAEELQVFKSAAIQVGVVVNLDPMSATAFGTAVSACIKSCSWDLATYQGYPFRILPTGEGLWLKGAPLDIGGYDSPTNNANVAATLHRPSPAAFYAYENYLVNQLPWIWLPSPDYRLSEVSSSLGGVTPQNVYLYLNPEDWQYST